MRSLLLLAALALATLALGGCADDAKDKALRSDPSFKEGYEDGCQAATDQGADLRDRPVGDQQLYKADETYRAGWSNGYTTCRRTDLAPAPGNGAITMPGPGH